MAPLVSWMRRSKKLLCYFTTKIFFPRVAGPPSTVRWRIRIYCEWRQWSDYFQDSMNTFLITLGNQGSVARVDTRVGVLPVATFHLLDKSHAKSISCHPLQPHLLLTGTNKGGCGIFDLRSSPGRDGLFVPATSLLGATRFGILVLSSYLALI